MKENHEFFFFFLNFIEFSVYFEVGDRTVETHWFIKK